MLVTLRGQRVNLNLVYWGDILHIHRGEWYFFFCSFKAIRFS